MSEAHHSIKVVSRRTGLTAHVIRIWEKRYGAVEPARTGTNRRLYSEEEIERLNLLRELTHAGHSIGMVAQLPTEELRQMLAKPAGESSAMPRLTASKSAVLLDECLAAVKALDSRKVEETLKRAATELGGQGLLQQVLAPLAQIVGDLWRHGTITAAHEHFASALIRDFLAQVIRPFAAPDEAPVVIVATPSGQLHELGALLAGALASTLGWRVTYLGASLPAVEIAGAARQNRARAVALSLVYPEDDPRMESELARLRELLPTDTAILAGGRAMPAYAKALERIGAVQIKDLRHLGSVLDDLRKPSKKPKYANII